MPKVTSSTPPASFTLAGSTKHPLKKFLLAALAFAALSPVAATLAGTFKLPEDKPTATVTIPDSWDPKKIDNGVEAQSPDDAIYLAVEATDEAGVEDMAKTAVEWLQEQGVKIDLATQKEQDFKVNGMEAGEIIWQGKDKDGACVCSLTFVVTGPKSALLITYWATPSEADKNKADVGKIVNSIKKAG